MIYILAQKEIMASETPFVLWELTVSCSISCLIVSDRIYDLCGKNYANKSFKAIE